MIVEISKVSVNITVSTSVTKLNGNLYPNEQDEQQSNKEQQKD
jgi:hypothetical protein